MTTEGEGEPEISLGFPGARLPKTVPFDKHGHVRQAAIVENRLLSAALLHARELQDVRDRQRLNSPSLNKRDKRITELERENQKLRHRAERAEALVEAQKKSRCCWASP